MGYALLNLLLPTFSSQVVMNAWINDGTVPQSESRVTKPMALERPMAGLATRRSGGFSRSRPVQDGHFRHDGTITPFLVRVFNVNAGRVFEKRYRLYEDDLYHSMLIDVVGEQQLLDIDIGM